MWFLTMLMFWRWLPMPAQHMASAVCSRPSLADAFVESPLPEGRARTLALIHAPPRPQRS
ncbi:hypothetical protein [Tibeticola sediminis]|uniref:hypothetical protein n=1 Tax=Tibeticola sediminis TaxID=1917811 RepID=UPI0014750563|nr:hypothetical protein [Tibeticola sediminis]MCI4440057.1 hypothetical protein [Tibeticola sp.]